MGNSINDEIKSAYENASPHGEKYLVYKVNKCKIYAKCWSDIFTEFEINNDFLLDKLKLQQDVLVKERIKTSSEIIAEQPKHASSMPQEIKIG